MSETVLPPNPYLLAIILVTKTRDGTSEVFHYPANPGASRRRRHRTGSTASTSRTHGDRSSSSNDTDASSSGGDEEDFAAFEDLQRGAGSLVKTGNGSLLHNDDSGASSPDKSYSGGHGSGSKWSSTGARAGRSHGGGGDGEGGGESSLGRAGLLGLPAGYHHFLCPPASFNKRRFELTIDQLVFLGRPAYAREDGSWRKERKKAADGTRRNGKNGASVKAESVARTIASGGAESSIIADGKIGHEGRRQSPLADTLTASASEIHAATSSEADSSAQENAKTMDLEEDEADLSEFEANHGLEAVKEDEKRRSKKRNGKVSSESLNMFNIVFVLNPPASEYQRRVDEMYRFVVKKFARALRYEQSRSNFILRETEHLRHLKSKHSSMENIIKHSLLARAIAEIFTSISASRIAQVDLTPRTSFSVQLPLPTSISVLPSLTEPQLPGIWLTTSHSMVAADTVDVDVSTSRSRLAAHFALLLLASPASIIAEVSASNSPLAPKLAHYLHHTKANKSFAQIAQSSGIPLADVQFLASHLIYWRRARAVPPLHHRDIYITSPNADMKRLRSASSYFSKAFPTLPSLPKMLSSLGAGPKPYSNLIPSKDHKIAYMDILAWLLRGGWVTQLRSYAWVRVTPEVRQRAREIARAEERARAERRRKVELIEKEKLRRQSESSGDGGREGVPSESGTEVTETDNSAEDSDELSSVASGSSVREAIASNPGEPDMPSGYLTPMDSSIYSTNSGDSAETARTTIPVRNRTSHSHLSTVETAIYDEDVDGRGDGMSTPNTESAVPLGVGKEGERDRSQSSVLILSPARASGMEIRYLTAIAAQMEEEDGHDAREAWERCLKYFNGEHAMEKIAVREGWKRKKVEALRARWRSRGVLLEVRHW